jgi:hypothetical protein
MAIGVPACSKCGSPATCGVGDALFCNACWAELSGREPGCDDDYNQTPDGKYTEKTWERPGEPKPVEPFPVKCYTGLPDPPDWLFPGLLEAGTCAILAAEPKVGKTWLTFDLGISLATGQTVLDAWTPRVRGTSLYYSPEGGHRSRHGRIAGLCWGRGLDPAAVLPSLLFIDARLDLGADGHAERLAATVDATKARLVVIDPLVSAHLGIDENSAGDVMRVLNPLRDMIVARPWCSLIVAHHSNKSAKTQALSLGIRGSSAIGGWWDSLIILRRKDDDSDGPRRIDIAHRDAAAPEPVGFELAHSTAETFGHPKLHWFRLDRCEAPELKGRKKRSKDPTLLEEILSFVREHDGELTRRAGARALKWDAKKFYRFWDELELAGKVRLGEGKRMELGDDA